ncbi:MAG: hypothetical protein JHD02_03620 [Thermoleophilaceae bacterium]|nr:hypothetical protein [Thermoleophilaceae bacterium]
MTDVATLLGEFLDELNAGRGPEAADFIEKAESVSDRIELAQGIEAVLAFAPDNARHPRDAASGALVSPVDSAQLAAVIEKFMQSSGELADAVPSWREAFGASVAEFARRILIAGGLAPTDGNVRAASGWVTRIESGAVATESLSDRAMRAVSTVLGSAPEDDSALNAMSLGMALRAEDDVPEDEVAEKLEGIADVLGDALPDDSGADDVDSWFSSDEAH